MSHLRRVTANGAVARALADMEPNPFGDQALVFEPDLDSPRDVLLHPPSEILFV